MKKHPKIFITLNFLVFFGIKINTIELDNNNSTNEKWQLPENRFYHEVAFLTSHNSHSNEEDGYIQPQQKWCLENQLKNGVRGFMLDTHYSSSLFCKNKKIRLCHGNCTITQLLLRPFKGKPMTFIKSLKIIKKFIENNPKEIITLFLENYAEAQDIDKAICKAGIQNYILKPKDWNPHKKKGWPHIRYLQKINKRIIIFNQKGETKFCFNEWECHYENQYGTTDTNRAIIERTESCNATTPCRYLNVMNYFPHFYIKPAQCINFSKINYNGTRRLLSKLKRTPNFIAADFVNEGELLSLVNQINKQAADINKRKQMFCPILKTPKKRNHDTRFRYRRS